MSRGGQGTASDRQMTQNVTRSHYSSQEYDQWCKTTVILGSCQIAVFCPSCDVMCIFIYFECKITIISFSPHASRRVRLQTCEITVIFYSSYDKISGQNLLFQFDHKKKTEPKIGVVVVCDQSVKFRSTRVPIF